MLPSVVAAVQICGLRPLMKINHFCLKC